MTGWGLIDLLLLVARGPGDTAVTLIVDAVPQPGLTASRQRLSAVNASATVRLRFDDVMVPGERFVSQVPFDPAASLRPDRLRVDGSLALGVARRCGRLLGPGPLDDELAACRQRLDAALAFPSYNFVVHTSPIGEETNDHYHWHIEMMPKLSKVAGFEWGTGFYINPTPPEEAARFLREATPR